MDILLHRVAQSASPAPVGEPRTPALQGFAGTPRALHASHRNAFVTAFVQGTLGTNWGFDVRSALLTFAMLIGVIMCGLGVYSVDASDHQPVDGYGVVARR